MAIFSKMSLMIQIKVQSLMAIISINKTAEKSRNTRGPKVICKFPQKGFTSETDFIVVAYQAAINYISKVTNVVKANCI
jgi:hypothetical protein